MNYLTVVLKGSSPCTLKLDYQLTAAPTSECSEVDFSGDAFWRLDPGALWLNFTGDLTGQATFSVGPETSAGRSVSGQLPVLFKAPLGDNSFTREGVLTVQGKLIFQDTQYQLLLTITEKPQDFSDLEKGSIDLSWELGAERIYYTGTFCFTGLNL